MEGSFWLAGNEAQVMVIDDLETFFRERLEHTATSKSTSAENFQKSQLVGSTAWNSDKSDLNNWRKIRIEQIARINMKSQTKP